MISRHPYLPLSLLHTYDPRLKKMTIRGASSFPHILFDIADDIEILDMSYGTMSELPDTFDRMRRLKTLFLSYNDFEEIPQVLSKNHTLTMIGLKSCKIGHIHPNAFPPNLRALILTDNRLSSLPSSIGKLKNLQKLTLTGNRLSRLPLELLACQNLELIRIAANDFSVLPEWLLQLPRLAWYSDAGNPGSKQSFVTSSEFTKVSWKSITLGSKIGESSKNSVYDAVLNSTSQRIAVKLYGGMVTADGYSADEIRAGVAAAVHANIIGVIGELTNTPDQQLGLAMQLIPKEFTSLALPPDFTTLTRDIYPAQHVFPLAFIIETLKGVSAALAHLHGKGIMHGDIYAHNILVNNEGFPYIGDFGAASLYDLTSSRSRERVEVRAFAYLMEELLSRCASQETPHDEKVLDKLKLLQQSCLQGAVSSSASISLAIEQELL